MTHYPYLIVGGGMTADAAIRGIRDVDPHGSIGLISAELHLPYQRPPLCKQLWQGKNLDSIWSKAESREVVLHLARSVRSLDLATKRVTDERVEHEDNATTMGRWAGRAMAGEAQPCHHLPFFYSDLFELSYEAVGDLDARLQMVSDWKEPHREGVVYYSAAARVRGVLLWNVWGQIGAARDVIAHPAPFRPSDLVGRLGGA